MTLQIWTAFGYWANCIVFMFSGYAIGLLLFNNPVEVIPYVSFFNFINDSLVVCVTFTASLNEERSVVVCDV